MDCRRYSGASRLGSAARLGWFSMLCTSSWTRRCCASFTTECDSPGTLKSMLCSSFWSTVTGISVPVWLFSRCLGVNTQRFVDSCPQTGLTVLVGSVTLSCFSWLRVSRSNLVRSRGSSLHSVTGLPVLDNWVLGFGSIRWMSLLLLANIRIQIARPIIFVGNRRWWSSDTYTFWCMISSDFITIAFEIQ